MDQQRWYDKFTTRAADVEYIPPPSPAPEQRSDVPPDGATITRPGSPPVGTVTACGIRVELENERGSYRAWRGPDGEERFTLMRFGYGEILGAHGLDAEPLDAYVGPDDDAPYVFVILQKKAPDFAEDDEEKCMIGFGPAFEKEFFEDPAWSIARMDLARKSRLCPTPIPDAPDVPGGKGARAAYLLQYDDPRFLGTITAVPVAEFRARLEKMGSWPKKIAEVRRRPGRTLPRMVVRGR